MWRSFLKLKREKKFKNHQYLIAFKKHTNSFRRRQKFKKSLKCARTPHIRQSYHPSVKVSIATTSQSNVQLTEHAGASANTAVEASKASLPDVFVEHAFSPDKPGTHQKAQGPLPQWDQEALDAAAMEAKVMADKANKVASLEMENKRAALMFQRDQLVKESNFKNLISECQTPERKPYVSNHKGLIRKGDYVHVEADLAIKGRSCWGGKGFVIDITGEGVDLK